MKVKISAAAFGDYEGQLKSFELNFSAPPAKGQLLNISWRDLDPDWRGWVQKTITAKPTFMSWDRVGKEINLDQDFPIMVEVVYVHWNKDFKTKQYRPEATVVIKM